MKILIIEYITGGGLAKQVLPASLLNEGEMMLTALVDDLLAVDDVELWVTRDYRLTLPAALAQLVTLITIAPEPSLEMQLPSLLAQCDAVWPIAPETDHVLYDLCRLIEAVPMIALISPAQTIRLATDKLETYRHLIAHNIAAVATDKLSGFSDNNPEKTWVIKPNDGVACAGVTSINQAQLRVLKDINQELLIQPFIKGRTLSLSCLFNQGKAWLICINEQLIEHKQDQFVLKACRVNIAIDKQPYLKLVEEIAQAMPGLWGYIGIDLIESKVGPLVLEINPRLTTSYTGINAALGINVAAYTLGLLNSTMPVLKFSRNQTKLIRIPQSYEF